MERHGTPVDVETLRALLRLVEDHALTELTIERDGFCLSLKADAVVPEAAAPQTEATPPEAAPGAEDDRIRLRAPMTGIFYRAPGPGQPPFVEVGDHVEVEQVVGMIEAMKVFSEVPAEAAGRVAEIPVGNGELVQQDQVLMVLEPEEGAGGG